MYYLGSYKLFGDVTLDFYKDIRKDIRFKTAHKVDSKKKLNDLLHLDDKELYDVVVNTQNLGRHKKDVMDFMQNYRVLQVQSAMATRKSNIVQEILDQSDKENKRVVMITNRVTLANDIALKYGIDHYQHNINGDSHLVIQFDSLYKVKVQKFDVVVIDEFTSLMEYITHRYADKENRHKSNILKLFGLCRHRKLAILDAAIIYNPFEENKDNVLGILNKFRETHNLELYTQKDEFIQSINRDIELNRNISISSNEKRFLVSISNTLKENNIEHILATSNTSEQEMKKYRHQFNDRDLDVGVILYSPTITTGISIMSRHIQIHYHMDASGTINAIESLQMIRRSRNAKEIKMFLNTRSSTLKTDIKSIRNNMLDYVSTNEWGDVESIDENGELLSQITLKSNVFRNGSKYSLLELLEYQFKRT